MRKQIILAIFLLAAVNGLAFADSLSDAMRALQADDNAKAAKLLLPLAQRGGRIAQSTLGLLYDYGKGVPQDYKEAAKWYLLSIAQGADGPEVPDRLAWMYRFGKGVTQEPKEALKWYRVAAGLGKTSALSSLGDMYGSGEGTPQDYVEAAQWYRLAAEYGDTSGQFHLGYMYGVGHGVPANIVLSHMWINIASANEKDGTRQKAAAQTRDSIAQLMTAQQLAEAQELAKKCTANKFKGC